jgi:peptidoglycan hydrolase-like protein with peptidoglycan-binding domain
MRLTVGDTGDNVKALQRGLNKLGSLLVVDGQFGDGTRDAIVTACSALGLAPRMDGDDELVRALANCPELSVDLGTPGATFIARAEIAGASEYRRRYCHPTWPSAASGVTIGIGYDLQFVSADQFRSDWGSRIPDEACRQLVNACGSRGSDALLGSVRDVNVPLAAAVAVFTSNTLPQTLQRTLTIYPPIADLPAARRTALVSLVHNRGTSLADRDPATQDRREMREIRDLLAAGDLDHVADQLDSMARLWDPGLPGLVRRRHDEATLWRSGFSALLLD